ncbi:MAG: 2-hydroxyacyl-CoA dehydratase family protein [Proteobacteria bacterium]|nr:2-hydroxyacyl-CoA dehydratase family protein [Pseudomonadota bacterium]MBU1648110.1 2-hydroxyacyl-CoA dehydratase family protein [Pseudomonadota bacterium]MBU1986128.1 2-hydroxyacyl-CoA dehydratase family protein [Pseudomonadota bacterium]
MNAESFEIKAYPEMWNDLGMDVERFDKMRLMLGEIYRKTYLTQQNRPARMAYFDGMIAEIHGGRIKELLAAKAEGRPVIGTFCVYIPEELVLAAGGVCVGLCGGSQGSVPDAEKILPRNICPMVKSAFGFKAGRICPYFQAVDFVYGETTCDAKKKTWEILDTMVPTYVMEIPQMKKQSDREMWFHEVKEFKAKVEEVAGKEVTVEGLNLAVKVMNNKRRALQRLNTLRHTQPTPISGKDVLLVEQIAFYDEPVRFASRVNELCDELEKRIAAGEAVPSKDAVRIMVAGVPMALPNWKLHHLVEGAGAVIVNEESCIGTRYYKDLMAEDCKDMEAILTDLTRRYMNIDCSCFTPNDERIDQVLKEFRESQADGIIHYSLQFCHTYNVEEIRIREACAREGIPYMFIESDYSPEDVGQIQTRVEAFLEQIRG